jgi:hypothetical protein
MKSRPCPNCKNNRYPGLVAPPPEPDGYGTYEDCPRCGGDGVVEYHPWHGGRCPNCHRLHPVDADCAAYDPHTRAMAEAS